MLYKVKVSVVIPVFNASANLRRCLDSVVKQTLGSIQILCIDDASTDDSSSILLQYANKDNRVKIITLPENSSTYVARREGALCSSGQYVMFLDADDYLEIDACQVLASRMDVGGWDILHFSSTIEGENNRVLSECLARIQENLLPWVGQHYGNLMQSCFVQQKFGYQLWNKIYSGQLMRCTIGNCSNAYLEAGHDMATFFIILFNCKSYCGETTKPLYHYCPKAYLLDSRTMGRQQIKCLAKRMFAVDEIRSYLMCSVENSKRYCYIADVLQQIIVLDALSYIKAGINSADIAYVWHMLCEFAYPHQIIAYASSALYGFQESVFPVLSEVAPSIQKTQVSNIAIFCQLSNEGRISNRTHDLIILWRSMGCNTILFAEQTDRGIYDLPMDCEYVLLPGLNREKPEQHAQRELTIFNMVRQHKIQTVVYSMQLENIFLWDMLAVKCAGSAFIVHDCVFHDLENLSYEALSERYIIAHETVKYSDAIICSDKDSVSYWSRYNGNIMQMFEKITLN